MTQSYVIPSPSAGLVHLARIKAGLSQKQLAAAAGVPATMISAYERDLRQPTMPTLMRLLRAAGFELQLHLVPYDSHDQVLIELESQRDPDERARRDRQLDKWRLARPSDAK